MVRHAGALHGPAGPCVLLHVERAPHLKLCLQPSQVDNRWVECGQTRTLVNGREALLMVDKGSPHEVFVASPAKHAQGRLVGRQCGSWTRCLQLTQLTRMTRTTHGLPHLDLASAALAAAGLTVTCLACDNVLPLTTLHCVCCCCCCRRLDHLAHCPRHSHSHIRQPQLLLDRRQHVAG